ncbi:MAG: AbrB/MazE/SpoVT family DNA-binding domain-containing protein [Gemmatimonadetes bacterium]|nr:AbrB/MazE/SpoVT family DNA-binding domain-containing protein [Gemmatimonadota bacterium]
MTIDKRGRVTLPEEVRRELALDEEANLVIIEKTPRGTFELIPAALIPNDQLWFHQPEMQARLADAEADFREGRSTHTATPGDAQRFLDSLKAGPRRRKSE